MIIVETKVYALGQFTIQQRPRPDNPSWAVYVVLLHARVIGRQFSVPTQSDCEWLQRQRAEELVYAAQSEYSKSDSTYSVQRIRGGQATKKNRGLDKARAYSLTSRRTAEEVT